ncbi:MAG: anti-sigma factor [Streptosporangiales bacterium]|nr:anti-sigma factor [Streptosporangiales bacterium]
MSHLGDRLTALVDGELGHDARDRALAHLTVCAECRAEAEAYRNLKAHLGRLGEPPPPSDLVRRLLGLAEPGGPMPRPLPPSMVRGTRGPMPGGWNRPGPGPIGRASFEGAPFGAAAGGWAQRAGGWEGEVRPGTGVRPRDNRPPTARAAGSAGSTRGRPNRLRYVLVGVASAAALALTAGFAAGGQSGTDRRAPRITPPVDTYAVEHAATVGDVPVARPHPAGPSGTVILTDTGP